MDNMADLKLGLEAKAVTSAGWFKRLVILLGIALGLALLARMGRGLSPQRRAD